MRGCAQIVLSSKNICLAILLVYIQLILSTLRFKSISITSLSKHMMHFFKQILIDIQVSGISRVLKTDFCTHVLSVIESLMSMRWKIARQGDVFILDIYVFWYLISNTKFAQGPCNFKLLSSRTALVSISTVFYF